MHITQHFTICKTANNMLGIFEHSKVISCGCGLPRLWAFLTSKLTHSVEEREQSELQQDAIELHHV